MKFLPKKRKEKKPATISSKFACFGCRILHLSFNKKQNKKEIKFKQKDVWGSLPWERSSFQVGEFFHGVQRWNRRKEENRCSCILSHFSPPNPPWSSNWISEDKDEQEKKQRWRRWEQWRPKLRRWRTRTASFLGT